MAQQAALDGGVLRGQSSYVDGDSRFSGAGAAASADRTAGEQQLRGEAGDLRLPPGFFVAGQFSHGRQVLADAGVPLLQLRQELVAKAVAGVGRVEVGGVLAPRLAERCEIRLNLGSGGGEHGAKNVAFWEIDDGMNAGKAFGPCAAQEFSEDRFRLVIESVGRGYGVELVRGHELAKPGVAEAAGGFLNGFATC